MKLKKGCINSNCKGYKNILYDDNEENQFCKICGQPLYYVCRGKEVEKEKGKYCFKVLKNDGTKPKEAICMRCKNEKDDKKYKNIDMKIKGVMPVLGAMALPLIGGVKKIIKK